MNWYCIGPERRRPPEEYVEHIARVGGINRFGDPNFRVVWGETAIETYWGDDEVSGFGQHQKMRYGVPAWHLEEWKPPECFGTPELWYAMSWDPLANTHILGEFPWRGLYMPCNFSLYVKRMIGGGEYFHNGMVHERPMELVIDAMPLTYWIIDLLIPNVIKAIDETHLQRLTAVKARMEAERNAERQRVIDMYLDATPAFYGVAGTYESNREAWTKRIEEKMAGMKISAEEIKQRMGTRHRQHRTPIG
jgi:hypothetical protein